MSLLALAHIDTNTCLITSDTVIQYQESQVLKTLEALVQQD